MPVFLATNPTYLTSFFFHFEGMPKSAEMPPEEYQLEENEERSMIEPRSFDNPKLKELIRVLIDWVNDELHHYRIIVQDIEEDLYDGQVQFKETFF